jgi:hypothetical protein
MIGHTLENGFMFRENILWEKIEELFELNVVVFCDGELAGPCSQVDTCGCSRGSTYSTPWEPEISTCLICLLIYSCVSIFVVFYISVFLSFLTLCPWTQSISFWVFVRFLSSQITCSHSYEKYAQIRKNIIVMRFKVFVAVRDLVIYFWG